MNKFEEIKKEAEKVYKEIPMPSLSEEKWRRTDVARIDLGAVSPQRLNLGGDRTGLVGKLVGPSRGKFQAFNLAKFSDVRTFEAKNGDRIEINVNALSDAVWRVVGRVNKDQSAVLVERIKTRAGYHSLVSEIEVADGAMLDYFVISEQGAAYDFSHRAIKLGKNSKLNLRYLWSGSAKSKNWLEVNLTGQGAAADIKGLCLLSGIGHLDLESEQNHLAADTKSDLLVKSASRDNSRLVYQGLVNIGGQASRSEAFQENRNILLSGQARADSIPALEILSDDVRCSHAVSVSSVPYDELFYAESRGISEQEARNMLVKGFIRDVAASFEEGIGGELAVKIEEFLK